jgi:uncharacterized protein (TIGR03437 family)
MDAPRALRLDGKGNLFIADYNNNRVRKVVLSTGVISLMAGNGALRASGDNGPATAAALDPDDIALDAAGNLYIADKTNNRIRKVDAANGKISTIAGTSTAGYSGDTGPANIATLDGPTGISVDASGNVYFCDSNNLVVRKIDQKTGTITSAIGNGFFGFGDPRLDGDNGPAPSARLIFPLSTAIEPNGDILVFTLYEFWRVTVSDNKIHVINVDFDIGFSGDGGTLANAIFGYVSYAASADNGDILLSDTGNFRVRRVHNGIINTVAGTTIADNIPATQAFLNHPATVLPDGKGGLLIADAQNNRVRAVSPSGIITNLVGTGINGSTKGQLSYPAGIALDALGNLFIADTGNNRIVRLPPGGNQSLYAGGNGAGFSGDNSFAIRARLSGPRAIAFDSGGTLYIADTNNARVRAVDSDGNITTLAGNGIPLFGGDNGPAIQSGLLPTDLAYDGAGSLYIADGFNNRIRKVNLSTKIITTVAGAGSSGYSGDGGAATGAQLNNPTGVAVDSAGTIYIADYGNGVVRRVRGGIISTIAGSRAPATEIENGPATAISMQPVRVAVDNAGAIYVTDYANDRIRKLTVATPSKLTLQSGDAQSGPPGKLVSVAVKVTDANGIPVAQVAVTFSVASGTATIANPTVQTGADGIATAVVTLGASVGAVRINASASALTGVTFSLTITAPPIVTPVPAISENGVTGAALSTPPVLSLSTGGIATAFGKNFGGGAVFQKVSGDDLVNGKVPTNFKNICVETGGVRSPVFGVSDTQINFQTGAIAGSGTVGVRVITGCGTANEVASTTVSVAAQTATPEFFYFAQSADRRNPVAATDSLTNQGIAPSSLFPGSGFGPAKAKQYVTIYFTGGGLTSPPIAPGEIPTALAGVTGTLRVTLGGVEVPASNILYCGITPFSPGLYQLNLLLPDDTPEGDLPLVMTISGVLSPTGYLAVRN